MLFRRMVEADLDVVADLEKETFSTPWSKEGFRESLQKSYSRFYVAYNEKIIGYCGIHNFGGDGEITNVAVHNDYRGKQVAFSLLTYAMEDWAKDGVECFTLEVRVSNVAAIGLYKKLGFVEEGVRKNFYENPIEDALIMWKN